jgi:hypothetical protein
MQQVLTHHLETQPVIEAPGGIGVKDLQFEPQPLFSALTLYTLKNESTNTLSLIRGKNSQIDT